MGRLFSSKKRLSDSSASRLAEKEQGRPAGWPAEVSYAQEGPTHTGEIRTAPARRLPATSVGCHPAACHGVGSGATRTATRLGPKDYAVFPRQKTYQFFLLIENKKLTKIVGLTGNDLETSGFLYPAMFCTNQKNAFSLAKVVFLSFITKVIPLKNGEKFTFTLSIKHLYDILCQH